MTSAKRLPANALTIHTGYWMRIVSNTVSHAFARKLESSGVTVAEWVILREMYSNNDRISPSAIADLTGLTRGAISKLITRLLEKNLVNRTESTDDRRYQEVKLTTKAISLVPKLASLADQNDQEFFSALTKAENHQLLSILKKLSHHHQIKTIPTE